MDIKKFKRDFDCAYEVVLQEDTTGPRSDITLALEEATTLCGGNLIASLHLDGLREFAVRTEDGDEYDQEWWEQSLAFVEFDGEGLLSINVLRYEDSQKPEIAVKPISPKEIVEKVEKARSSEPRLNVWVIENDYSNEDKERLSKAASDKNKPMEHDL